MAKHINFNKMLEEERQVVSQKVVSAIFAFLRLFISPIIARRIINALFIIAGLRNDRITKLTGLCEHSILDLKKTLVNGDINDILKINEGRGRKSKFKDIESQIAEEIENGNYQNLQQIADMVHDKFGIKVSIMAVSRFIKKNEIRKLKAGSLPAKADTRLQREFYDSVLLPLMKKAKRKNSAHVLLFMDASHFVLGCNFLGGIYSKSRTLKAMILKAAK